MAGRASTRQQRAARDARIRKAAATGETVEAIAATEKVSVRTVFRVLGSAPAATDSAELEVRPLLQINPWTELAHAIALHRDVAERLRQLATAGRNESAAVGAARSAAAVSRDLIGLLTQAGLLPSSRYGWRSEIELSTAWTLLKRVLHEAGIEFDGFAERLEAELAELDDGRPEVSGVAPGLAVAA
jgi:hypothetical protein